MTIHPARKRFAPLVASTLLVASAVLAPAVAEATNKGSVSGVNRADACALDWDAVTLHNTKLTDKHPIHPNLMTGLDGKPIADYQNGGYIEEVRPEYGNPGLFEITHFFNGALANENTTATDSTTMNWRIPVATDHDMNNATVHVHLPTGVNFKIEPNVATPEKWGDPYAKYTWSKLSADNAGRAVSNQDTRDWVIPIGSLKAGQGVMFQLTGTIPAGERVDVDRIATANLHADLDCATGSLGGSVGSVGDSDSATGSLSDGSLGGSLALGSLGKGSIGDGSTSGSGPADGGGSTVPGSTTGSLGEGSLGSLGELVTGSLGDAGSFAGSLGALPAGSAGSTAAGSSTGSLALGSLGLGAIAIGGLIWGVQTGAITLPAGLTLPALPGVDWNTVFPPAAQRPVPPAPQAPGPDTPNGRG